MGRLRLDLLVPALALSAWIGCTSISGLDGLAFDLAPASGGAGGQGGSTASGGAGGGVTLCADRIDVAGLTLEPGGEGAPVAPTIVAGKYGRVGSLWNVGPDVLEIIITDLGGGSLLDDGIGGHPSADYRTTIAATDSHFVIAYARANDVGMRFYVQQTALQEPGTLGLSLPISQTGDPLQAHVVAGADGGVFTSVARAGGDFFHAIARREAGDWTVSQVNPFSAANGKVCCCTSRAWAATGADQYHVAWPSDCAQSRWELEIFDLAGVSTGTGQISDTSGAPKLATRLGDEVIFANCGLLVRLDTQGQELGRVALPGTGPGSCTIVSTGSELRWAVNEGNAMLWYALDPIVGVGELLLSLDVTNGAVPAATWDGSGFPLMWPLAGQAAYARIACD